MTRIKLGPDSGVPRGVWLLGFVSLLMDVSSEMIHALLPLYLTVALGASALVVGVIEGVAEAVALIVRAFSGALSDRLRHRKWVAAAGYGIGALAKPLFAIAAGPGLVFTARFLDRIGKGIRGAPRDALIADLTPAQARGTAFGLSQSLDTVGAFAGPSIAMGLMLAWNDDFRAVFWVAVIPAMLSFALIALAVEEPPHEPPLPPPPRPSPKGEGALLRAADLGVAPAYAPLVLVGMSLVYSLVAYPAGKLADRMPRSRLLASGVAALLASHVVLALAGSLAPLALGVALWGLHMGLTQGLLSALVAHAAPAELRGTAFGLFSLACGLAMVVSSTLAGALWQLAGPPATFWAGAGFALACLALIRWAPR
jgi:MFS family permease